MNITLYSAQTKLEETTEDHVESMKYLRSECASKLEVIKEKLTTPKK